MSANGSAEASDPIEEGPAGPSTAAPQQQAKTAILVRPLREQDRTKIAKLSKEIAILSIQRAQLDVKIMQGAQAIIDLTNRAKIASGIEEADMGLWNLDMDRLVLVKNP